jgi:hypothetical protein
VCKLERGPSVHHSAVKLVKLRASVGQQFTTFRENSERCIFSSRVIQFYPNDRCKEKCQFMSEVRNAVGDEMIFTTRMGWRIVKELFTPFSLVISQSRLAMIVPAENISANRAIEYTIGARGALLYHEQVGFRVPSMT